MKLKTVSIIIPCFNEIKAIPKVMENLHFFLQNQINLRPQINIEIIVVDDCSTDGSFELLKNYDFIQLLRCDFNSGYGFCLKRGFQKASGDFLSFMDMDDTYDVSDILRLIDEMNSQACQIVFGRRSFWNSGMPNLRRLGNAFFRWQLKLLYNSQIQDVCTGMRLFHKDLLPNILSIPVTDLNFSIALTAHILKNRISHREISIIYRKRLGESKLRIIRDGWAFFCSAVR